MYLGSRPAASVARSYRADVSIPGLGLPDFNVGWPIHHGQSNKAKYHHYHAVAGPKLRGNEECHRLDNTPATPFLSTRLSLTEFQQWPKSEFELVAEEDEELSTWKAVPPENNSNSSQRLYPSEWSFSDETLYGSNSNVLLSKSGSMEETMTVERTKSDGISNGIGDGDDDMYDASSPGRESTTVCPLEGHRFLETEFVYNRHAHEMKLTLPVESTKSDRPSKRQTAFSGVCRQSACRRRVHPFGKFADEFVNWMPQSGTTDDEKGEDDDKSEVVDFKHCINDKAIPCNGIHAARVHVKHNCKRSGNLSKSHQKRKRAQLSAVGKDGGLHRRRKQHNPWSIAETRMLIKGVSMCGEGHWADIKRLEFTELASRSPVDLKDKWRNLLRLAQFSHINARNKKGEKRTDLPSDMLQQVRQLGSCQSHGHFSLKESSAEMMILSFPRQLFAAVQVTPTDFAFQIFRFLCPSSLCSFFIQFDVNDV